MSRYAHLRPTPVIGAAFAVLATAATLAVTVLVPARLMPNTDPGMVARTAPAGAIEVAIVPAHIEVIGTRRS